MKCFLAFFAFIIISINLFGQSNPNFLDNKEYDFSSYYNEYTEYFPNPNSIWILDSTYENWIGYQAHIKSLETTKSKVVSRNFSDFPLRIEFFSQTNDTNVEELIKHIDFQYPDPADSSLFSYITTSLTSPDPNLIFRTTINYNENDFRSHILEVEYEDEWYNGSKVIWKTNSANDFQIQRFHRMDPNIEWELTEKQSNYFTDDSTKLIYTEESIIWGQMDSTYKSTRHYNGQNKPYLYNSFEKNSNNVWEKRYKSIWEYEDGKTILYQIYTGDSDEWKNHSKDIYSYDENGFRSSTIAFSWDNLNNWIPENRVDFAYDEFGKILTQFSFDLISDSVWIYSYKYHYTYDSLNQVKIQTNSYYNALDSIWIFDNRYCHDYINNLKTLKVMQRWDTLSAAWLPITRVLYDYDINGQRVFMQSENWSLDDQTWIPYLKTINSFEENELQAKQSQLRFNYHGDEDVWNLYDEESKYYNRLYSNTISYQIPYTKLYPNPSSHHIIIDTDIYHSQNNKYEIIDIQGRVIESNKLAANGQVDVKHLQQGVYFIRVYSPDGKALTMEFVKQ